MIKEIKLKHFDTNDPPKHESTPYPVVNDELPKLFPCGAFCGAVGLWDLARPVRPVDFSASTLSSVLKTQSLSSLSCNVASCSHRQ
jgi:hypothetical protein